MSNRVLILYMYIMDIYIYIYIYIHINIGYRFYNAHKTLPSHIMHNLKYKSND